MVIVEEPNQKEVRDDKLWYRLFNSEREREVLIISSRKRSKGRQTRQRQERRKQRRSATPSDPPREKLTQIRLKSWRCNLLRYSVSVREVLQEVVQTCILKMELFEFCDCVGFLSLEKERGYMFEDIWTFSIKQKRVTWRWSFPLKKMESCLKCIWKTWRASWRRGEQVLVAI